ncbi:LD-carboxypeptidase [Virgibacillus sp. NKC19-3]|uniref:S66 peptidase family protein n=1 Tax=Virgibacillus saliphilus TaxID=2831674 RepID=UPI001C9B021D|nr:LD-carboxypeptidase [Virgibacillus sp. NKC19-3]
MEKLVGKTVGLIACSDGRDHDSSVVSEVMELFSEMGITSVLASTIYHRGNTPFSGSSEERACQLMKFFKDEKIAAIFDISGGNSANHILPYLDYAVIRENPKPFLGISDLSVILNAIYARSTVPTFHYQVANLVGEHALEQRHLFRKLFLHDSDYATCMTFDYSWLRGKEMTGVLVGGNLRCFLKLAGTLYMPDPTNKIVFLESLGGRSSLIASLLSQLDQIGYFEHCNGVLLGTFTQMVVEKQEPSIEELVFKMTQKYQLPVAVTNQLGHGDDTHCLPIGTTLSF